MNIQVSIPKKQRQMAKREGIGTEYKQKVAVRITNLKSGEAYTARLAITGTHQLSIPVEIQKMLKSAGKIRLQII